MVKKELWDLREAQLETQILDLLQEKPLTINAIRLRLNVSGKLVKRALRRHEGICVKEQEDKRWVLLDEPADIPEELVIMGETLLDDKIFKLHQRLIVDGLSPCAVGFASKASSFYWDEEVFPADLQPSDWVVVRTNTYFVESIENLGIINHRRERGHHYRIVAARPRIVKANQAVLRRHYLPPDHLHIPPLV